MVVAVFLMGLVATVAWVICAEMADALRDVGYPTAKVWFWLSVGFGVSALGLYGYCLFLVML